ncbi:MAG: hypothetical protein Q9160_000878 [Pyrenula sp. 1 TL-2023]
MNSNSPPFDYEDFMEEVIRSKVQNALKYDPSGKLGELQTKPQRLQQRAWRAKFDDPSYHIEGPSTYSLSGVYEFKAMITHRENLEGNPESKPVVLALEQAALKIEADDTTQYMVLQQRDNELPHELQPVYGRAPPDLDESAKSSTQESSKISLAVGETYDVDVAYNIARDWGEPLEIGLKYALAFKNARIAEWEWGDAKVS